MIDWKFVNRLRLSRTQCIAGVLVLGSGMIAYAVVPNQFVPGTTISAQAMNANNAHFEGRIAALEAQDVVEAFGTGQLPVTAVTAGYVLVPGLSVSVNLPSAAKVHVSTNGGIQCSSAATTAYSVVDLALFVDDAISTSAGQRRVIAANTTAATQMIANWSFGRTYSLPAGNHVIEIRAATVDPVAATANVSSGGAPQLQGILSVLIVP